MTNGTILLAGLLLAGATEPPAAFKGDEDSFVSRSYSLFVDCVARSAVGTIEKKSRASASAIADAAFAACGDEALLYRMQLQTYLNDKDDPRQFSEAARDEAETIYQRRVQMFHRNVVNAIPKLRAEKTK